MNTYNFLATILAMAITFIPNQPHSSHDFVKVLHNTIVQVEPGETVTHSVKIQILPEYYIMTNESSNEHLLLTTLYFAESTGIKVGSPIFPQPIILEDPEYPMEIFINEISINFTISADKMIAKGSHIINGLFFYQACDATKCYYPREFPIQIEVKVASDGQPNQ